MTKSEARGLVRERLASLSPEERKTASARICAALQDLLSAARPSRLGIFASLPDEPDLASLLAEWSQQGISIACPRVEGESLHFHQIATWDDFNPGAYQIQEPLAHAPLIDVSSLDLILVPGRAFDASGHRLGRGKGYYDRVLARLTPQNRTLGVFFSCQQLPEVPREAHDIPLHAVLHEKGFLEIR